MANLGGNFDATTVDPNGGDFLKPPGEYLVQMVRSEMKATKDGSGQFLECELDILDGEYKGQKMWDRLNLRNNNAKAVEIAQRTLSQMCHATGKLSVSDSEQLHGIPMICVVKHRKPKEPATEPEMSLSYKPVNGSGQRPVTTAAPANQAASQAAPQTGAATGGFQQPAQQAAAPTAAKTPPWKRAG